VVAHYLYRKLDGVFITGGCHEVYPPEVNDVPDFVTYGVAEFSADDQPDLVKDRFDPILGKRPATAAELAAAADAALQEGAQTTSRQKDILATCALIVRYSNPTAWTAMTVAQKKAATLAAADIWGDLRVFAEKNL
jgi:hypothetical protein